MLVGQRVGKQILEALGLQSDRCVSFELRVAVNEVVTIKAEYHAEGDPSTIAEVFSGYMVKRDG
jgi:hypothetical protein